MVRRSRKLYQRSYKNRPRLQFSRYGRNPQMMSTKHRGSLPHTSLEKNLRDIQTSNASTHWVTNYGGSTGRININTV